MESIIVRNWRSKGTMWLPETVTFRFLTLLPLLMRMCAAIDDVIVDDVTCPANKCTASLEMIIRCDDRLRIPPSVNAASSAPWSFTGRFDGGTKCTGSVLGSTFVLTAAHCFDDSTLAEPVTFSLAQVTDCDRPFDSVPAKRVHFPHKWIERIDAGPSVTDGEEYRSFDFAIVELSEPIANLAKINYARYEYIDWSTLQGGGGCESFGYPRTVPDDGVLGSPFWTGHKLFHDEQPYGWLNGGEGDLLLSGGESGLLYTYLDGTGGQSGSPVYVQNGSSWPVVIGVLIGSPKIACERNQNWVARLVPGSVQHIGNLVSGVEDSWWQTEEFGDGTATTTCDAGGGLGGGLGGRRRRLADKSVEPV